MWSDFLTGMGVDVGNLTETRIQQTEGNGDNVKDGLKIPSD